ncbi:MAG: thiazole synthase [Candidatus Omnitrophica bacterium]|nr:thiazole synthase [Candidatus Omnitrophota bacterium]
MTTAATRKEDLLEIGSHRFSSRLILGTGKYPSPEVMRQALEASGAQLITVAVRRVDLKNPSADPVLGHLDAGRYTILPNTAGCFTAEEAIRVARLGRATGLSNLIKLEVIGDPKTLLPDNQALLEATGVLVKEGFVVMPYTSDDPILCRRLEEAGAACVMPLAAPIGSGQGILNPLNIRFIREAVKVPVIVDAGVGTASDAAIAMELGVDGVLMNTGVAGAQDPVGMARAMRLAVEAGRLAFLAGRIPRKIYASASSPETGKVGS